MIDQPSPLREALREALPGAIKAREAATTRAIRSALAAVENAEAVGPVASAVTASSEFVAGAAVGVGAAEAERHELSDSDVLEIVSSERDERLAAAQQYRALGRIDEALVLEQEAAALDAFLC